MEAFLGQSVVFPYFACVGNKAHNPFSFGGGKTSRKISLELQRAIKQIPELNIAVTICIWTL